MTTIVKLFLLASVYSTVTFADAGDLAHRPPSFAVGEDKIVFVDFHTAAYQITYDIAAQRATVRARITFTMPESGRPVFDLLAEPSAVVLDGQATSAPVVATPGPTKVRAVALAVGVGEHVLEVSAPIENLLEFPGGNSVKSAFWVTDLRDRYYLERYLPVNLEYDRVAMTFDVEFAGLVGRQHIFTNGTLTWDGDTKARVEFPAKWTMNSVYFHTTPVGAVQVLQFDYPGVGGRRIPVTIYQGTMPSAPITTWKRMVERAMDELERDYGPFPHETLTIHDVDLTSMGLGGMEYAGATATNLGVLGHELFHSWFARAVTPANGNAGWIDEALASWRDRYYSQYRELYEGSRMAGLSAYARATHLGAYGFGATFMGHLDYLLTDKGGLRPFLRQLLETHAFRPLFTSEFVNELEAYAGRELRSLFVRWTGFGSAAKTPAGESEEPHPIHRKMTEREMRLIL